MRKLFDLAIETRDAIARATTVDLELGFARPPPTDATGEARQPGIEVCQARQVVLELSKLNLQLAGSTLRMLRKDVQNKLGAVDDFQIAEASDGASLGTRQIVIENDQ